MCVAREQQFIIANLILQLGIHEISGPYRLLVSVDVRYLIMHAHFSCFYILEQYGFQPF